MNDTNAERTIWCGNLSEKVTEEILYELFYQVGPLERVNIPKNRDGSSREYGFVTFCHTCSVEYALKLLRGTRLFDQEVLIKNRVQRNNTDPSYSNPYSSRTPELSHSDFIRGLTIPNAFPRLSTSEINNRALRNSSYSSHVHRAMLPSRNYEQRNSYKRKYEENQCPPEPTFKTPYIPPTQTHLNYDNYVQLGRQMLIGPPLIQVNGTIQDSYYGTRISPARHDQNSSRTSYRSDSDRNSNNLRRRSDQRHHRSYDRYSRRSN